MKYLIIILLAFITLGVQAQKKDRIVNNKIAPDSISTQIARVDTLKFNDGTSMSTASTGSTIYANNGLMMNGDTVILGNFSPMYYPLIVKNELDNWQNTLQMSSSGPELLSYRLPTYELMAISMFNRNQGNPYIQLLHSRDNKSFIAKFDSSGIQYKGIDTTLTTPLHLMTEAQVKREIAAAREWISNGEAINYNYGGRTVVNIGNEGSIHVYDAITNYESILTGYEVIVGDAFLYRDGSMRLKVIDCSLTDGSPTQGELSSCAGSASLAGQIKLIKDNTTSEMYQIIANGTNWSYIKYTTP